LGAGIGGRLTMCGICGVVTLAGREPAIALTQRAEATLRQLRHRGPDDARVATAGAGAIGAARLAIRALSEGVQPFVHVPTGVVVACNGEIDNHRELRLWLAGRGHALERESDVGVVPALYLELGERFVERLVGAFAVAIWDPRIPCVVLARDRAGEKPLFYVARDREIVFASELAALASDPTLPLSLDREAITGYLRNGCFVAPATPFREVRRVGPGEIVSITPDGVSARRFFDLRFSEAAVSERREDVFDLALRGAVTLQSDVAVPYGLFLSGGLDSSLIGAVLRDVRSDVPFNAYTIRFAEDSYDEGPSAASAARALGIPLASMTLRASDVPREIAALVAKSGEPLADPAWVPYAMLARRAAEDVRVAFVGEGADELFGGYPTYLAAAWADRFDNLPRIARTAVRSLTKALPVTDRKVAASYLLKRFVEADGLTGLRRHRAWTSQVPACWLEAMGVAPAAGGDAAEPGHLLDIVQRHDFSTTLAEGLLTKADRAGMGAALELRAPFLDAGVLDFARGLPPHERVHGLTSKVFLKRFARRYLPASLIRRKKRGLSVPLSAWLRGPLRDWTRGLLSSPKLATVGIDPAGAIALFEDHCARRSDLARPAWTIAVLSIWLNQLEETRRNRKGAS
jgi:asparagine synthase (glutamine-hydrolysing)